MKSVGMNLTGQSPLDSIGFGRLFISNWAVSYWYRLLQESLVAKYRLKWQCRNVRWTLEPETALDNDALWVLVFGKRKIMHAPESPVNKYRFPPEREHITRSRVERKCIFVTTHNSTDPGTTVMHNMSNNRVDRVHGQRLCDLCDPAAIQRVAQ